MGRSPAEAILFDETTGDPRDLGQVRAVLARHGDRLDALARDWRWWARPEQATPAGLLWSTWVALAGRGFGKTRLGAEFILDRAEQFGEAGYRHRFALVSRTVADTRDVMVEGESGLLACAERRGHAIHYEPSKRRVTMKDLGSLGTTFTGEKPDQLRGPQFHTAWADEPAAWKLLADREGNTAWTNLELSCRLDAPDGNPALAPRICATTTPKPIPLVKAWIEAAAAGDPSIVITRGSMMENRANLAPRFLATIIARYAGTRLAAQEIDGMYLEAVEGALWSPDLIDLWRLRKLDDVPALSQVVIAVDPSGSGPSGDACGIVVVGVEAIPANPLRRHLYVLEDLSSDERPEEWAKIVCAAYWRHAATAVVAEVNFGAALVADVIHLTDSNVYFHEVRASRGKRPRAEPVALLYDQGRAHHVGTFGMLESEMCTWVPDDDDSPDRMDALVWGAHYLLPEISVPPTRVVSPADLPPLPTGAEAMVRGRGGDVFGDRFTNRAGLWLPTAA